MSELVKTITVGEETRELGVKWENVENQPNISDLKYQLETLEDRTAHFVYPSIPVIKFSVDSTLSAKVVRGNNSEIEILALNNETVAHNKNAANRYSGSVADGDFQFNAIVEVPEGKAAYIECEKTDETHPYSNVDTVERLNSASIYGGGNGSYGFYLIDSCASNSIYNGQRSSRFYLLKVE